MPPSFPHPLFRDFLRVLQKAPLRSGTPGNVFHLIQKTLQETLKDSLHDSILCGAPFLSFPDGIGRITPRTDRPEQAQGRLGGSLDNMEYRLRKKLLMIGAAVVIVLTAVIVVLVSQANRILKHQLEQALGDQFTVESLSLGWNRVEVNEPRFMKDGRITAQAKQIVLKPEILDLLKPGFSISSAILEEPSVTLQIDKSGRWVPPFQIGKKQETSSSSKPGSLSIRRIEIKEGTLLFQDHHRPDPNRIKLRKIHLSLDRVVFPLEDAPSTFVFQAQIEGNLVSGSASGSGTIHFGTLAIDGKFEGRNLVALDSGPAGPAARVQGMSFAAASEGAAAKGLLLSDLVLIKPYLRLEGDRKGHVSSPLSGGATKDQAGGKEGAPVPVEVKNLKIEGGELLYLDGRIARRPYPVRITDIDLTADRLSFPADSRNTVYRLSARLPGNHSTGVLTSAGNTALKTLDTSAKVSLRDLDLTGFKPYLLKEGDVDVSRGFLDLDVNLGIRKRMLYAPARSVLRDLQFVDGKDLTGRFLNLPRSLVVNTLKKGNNRIEFDFVLEGSLDNPKFSLRESVMTRLTVGLAKRLGLSVVETGETAIIRGGRLMKGVGDVMKQIVK